MNCLKKTATAVDLELLYTTFFKILGAIHNRLDIFKIMSDAQVSFVSVQNLYF